MMVYRDVARNPEDDRLNEYIDLAKETRQVVAKSWRAIFSYDIPSISRIRAR